MADKSSREIERELEHKRAELSDTIDEALNRMTLEGAWTYAGRYLRDNRGTYGQTVGSVIKEKPLAVGLVAVGMAWIMFGPSTKDRRYAQQHDFGRRDREHDAETRARLADADFDDTRAEGPTGPDARPDPWAAPSRTSAPSPGGSSSSGLGGASSMTSGTSNSPAGPSTPSTESPGGSSDTRSGVAEPKPAAPAVVPASTPASTTGGQSSTGSTTDSEPKRAGDADTSSATTAGPKSPKP